MALQQIKDEYAKTSGYNNWISLLIDCSIDGDKVEFHMSNILILVQKALQNKIAENAKIEINNTRTMSIDYVSACGGNGKLITIHKQSILSENLLIK